MNAWDSARIDFVEPVSTSHIANRFRVLLTATAYVLFQEVRTAFGKGELSRATVDTLRTRLLKIGASVTESVRIIVISTPSIYPGHDLWRRAAARVAAIA